MIPEDYLSLSLLNVLALHKPRRYNGASVEQLEAALRALEVRLARACRSPDALKHRG